MQPLISALTALTISLTAFAATIPSKNYEVVSQINQPVEDQRIVLLNKCENSGNWDTNTILDTDGYYSYGGLMYHLKTFRDFSEKYGVIPKGLSDKEIKTIIYDRDLQTKTAIHMLDDGLWNQWYWCSIKQKIAPEEVIKKYTK